MLFYGELLVDKSLLVKVVHPIHTYIHRSNLQVFSASGFVFMFSVVVFMSLLMVNVFLLNLTKRLETSLAKFS